MIVCCFGALGLKGSRRDLALVLALGTTADAAASFGRGLRGACYVSDFGSSPDSIFSPALYNCFCNARIRLATYLHSRFH